MTILINRLSTIWHTIPDQWNHDLSNHRKDDQPLAKSIKIASLVAEIGGYFLMFCGLVSFFGGLGRSKRAIGCSLFKMMLGHDAVTAGHHLYEIFFKKSLNQVTPGASHQWASITNDCLFKPLYQVVINWTTKRDS